MTTELSVTFTDVDPCTGRTHAVTFDIVLSRHTHDGTVVEHSARTITTDSGYVGHGVDTLVVTDRVLKATAADIAMHPDGRMFRARANIQIDLGTGTVRVERIGLVCVRGS